MTCRGWINHQVSRAIPAQTQIVANVGDFDLAQARQLRAAGVDGAYHVCRLNEGQDTKLDPKARRATVEAIKEAGMDWYYCCESPRGLGGASIECKGALMAEATGAKTSSVGNGVADHRQWRREPLRFGFQPQRIFSNHDAQERRQG